MVLLALAKTDRIRSHSSINTKRTAILFIHFLPSTTLLPRGETLFHLSPINIVEKFKDFSPTTRNYSKTFHQQPENIQRLFRLQHCLSRKSSAPENIQRLFWPAKLSQPQITNIPEVFKDFPANSNNQQKQPAAAMNSSNQQRQPAAATSSNNQQQQSAFILPATPTQSTPTSVSYHYGS